MVDGGLLSRKELYVPADILRAAVKRHPFFPDVQVYRRVSLQLRADAAKDLLDAEEQGVDLPVKICQLKSSAHLFELVLHVKSGFFQDLFLFEIVDIGVYHLFYQHGKIVYGLPSQLLASLAGISDEQVDLRRTIIPG